MNMVRGLVAIVIGYLLLAAISMGIVASLFGTGTEPELKSRVFALAGLAVGAIIAGVVCTLIVGSANHPAIYITLGVVIFMAGRAFFMNEGIEPDWYRAVGTLTQCVGFLVGASVAAYRLDS